jgi:cysteine desulfurase/selenocysteine lyase
MDWNSTRLETPSCQDMIHFNNAGSSLMPNPVLNEVLEYLHKENQIGGYELMFQEAARINQVYASIAKLINAKDNEIALFENATRAFQAMVYGMSFEPGDIILTSSSEYISNYLGFLHLKKTKGIELVHLKEDEYGQTSLEDFKLKCKELKNIKLLSLCHIPTQSGLINMAKEFGEVAREEGIFYFLDTTQSVGHLHIDVEDIGCDAIVGTGRKIFTRA